MSGRGRDAADRVGAARDSKIMGGRSKGKRTLADLEEGGMGSDI